jgi:hypothetical protein
MSWPLRHFIDTFCFFWRNLGLLASTWREGYLVQARVPVRQCASERPAQSPLHHLVAGWLLKWSAASRTSSARSARFRPIRAKSQFVRERRRLSRSGLKPKIAHMKSTPRRVFHRGNRSGKLGTRMSVCQVFIRDYEIHNRVREDRVVSEITQTHIHIHAHTFTPGERAASRRLTCSAAGCSSFCGRSHSALMH